MNRRIRLKDIAERTGFTVATVSMALRQSPLVAKATRERIVKEARRMGYVPDPNLTALAAYRSALKVRSYRATLAMVTETEDRSIWEWHTPFSRRAEALGYRTTPFVLRHPEKEWPVLIRTLRARGIRGLYMAPRSRIDEVFPEVDLEGLCLVTVGPSVKIKGITRYGTHQFLNTQEHLEALWERGYRRPGLCLAEHSDARVNGQFSGGFHVAYARRKLNPPRILSTSQPEEGVFRQWVSEEGIDVVVGMMSLFGLMRQWGMKIPGEIGFSVINLNRCEPPLPCSGFYYDRNALHEAAADGLHAQLINPLDFAPGRPLLILNQGFFIDGGTTGKP